MQAERSMASTDCRVRTFCGHVHVLGPVPYGPAAGLDHDPVPDVADPMPVGAGSRDLVPSAQPCAPGHPAARYAPLDHERSTLTSVCVPYDIDAVAQKSSRRLRRRSRRGSIGGVEADAPRFVGRRAGSCVAPSRSAAIWRRQVGA